MYINNYNGVHNHAAGDAYQGAIAAQHRDITTQQKPIAANLNDDLIGLVALQPNAHLFIYNDLVLSNLMTE